MGTRINLVEDEKNLNSVLTSYLEKEGWEVKSFKNGSDAFDEIDDSPDIWILDIMLPGIDGFELLREIRKRDSMIPVIFISARDKDIDRVIGLEMGSDDYLAKPFLPRELVIRVKKILERVHHSGGIIFVPPYKIDEARRTVTEEIDESQSKLIELTSMEFDLLLLFINGKGKPFSRDQILDRVWGYDHYGSDRAVDDLVRRLRKKMPHFKIETVYGFGYKSVNI
ncbi:MULTISPECIES: response regulator transcription factor [unclassified Mesotoga]|uniref:response regulator transcription factor n=1 Tax=unclassified Mesotoga TaxID=1184398 RepID=UPI000DA68D9B|nr:MULTISPECIES: response regulator transcription factor [unclassified Mesotoga]PZC53145.1 transcriptional regulator [Mesotoga sp. TolDC]